MRCIQLQRYEIIVQTMANKHGIRWQESCDARSHC